MDYWRVPAVLMCFVLLLFFAKEDSGNVKEEVKEGHYLCLQYIPFSAAAGHSALALNPAYYAAIC